MPISVGVLLGAALAAVVVLAVVLKDGGRDAADSPNPPAAPGAVPVTPVATATPTDAQTPTPTTVETPVPTADERDAVRRTFTTFFAGIEAGDYEKAFDLRRWERRSGVSREEALEKFAAEYSTTTYDPDVTIGNFRYDGADILVDVAFTSRQAVDKAPPGGGTCTRWDLYYRMVWTSDAWLIADAKARSGQKYMPC